MFFFYGTNSKFCCHVICFLVQPVFNFATTICSSCWNQLIILLPLFSFLFYRTNPNSCNHVICFWYNQCTFLLQPTSVFVGTNQLFCYYVFWGEPVHQFLCYHRLSFCYNQCSQLLHPTRITVSCNLLEPANILDWSGMIFCWNQCINFFATTVWVFATTNVLNCYIQHASQCHVICWNQQTFLIEAAWFFVGTSVSFCWN